ARGGLERGEVGGARQRRLLEDDVLLRGERGERVFFVQVRRREDRDRVGVARERLVVRVRAEALDDPAQALGARGGARRDPGLAALLADQVAVALRDAARAEEDDLHAASGARTPATKSAVRSAVAAIVRLGLTPADIGSALPSAIHSPGTPRKRPAASTG